MFCFRSFLLVFLVILLLHVPGPACAQPWNAPETEQAYKHATDFEAAKNWSEAATVYRRLLVTCPADSLVTAGLCRCLFALRKFAEAEQVLVAMVSTSKQEKWFEWLATAQLTQGKTKLALHTLKRAIAVFPDSGNLYALSGECHYLKHQYQRAENDWISGYSRSAQRQENIYGLCKLYSRRSQLPDAILLSEIYLNLDIIDTSRADEIRKLMLSDSKRFFDPGFTSSARETKNYKPFFVERKQIAKRWILLNTVVSDGVTTENLTMLRIRFLLDWNLKPGDAAEALFSYQGRMLREGWLDIYGEWLFGAVEDPLAYQAWVSFHRADYDRFLQWKTGHPFVLPVEK